MHKEGKNHVLIPALIAMVAAYFGFRRKSETLSEVAKELVGKAIQDQTNHNKHFPRRKRKRSLRDRYYA
jgi:hypothetical protein